jgi:hypothetical protein
VLHHGSRALGKRANIPFGNPVLVVRANPTEIN